MTESYWSDQLNANKKRRIDKLAQSIHRLRIELWRYFSAMDRVDWVDVQYAYHAGRSGLGAGLPEVVVGSQVLRVLHDLNARIEQAKWQIKQASAQMPDAALQDRCARLDQGGWATDSWLHRKMREYAPPLTPTQLHRYWSEQKFDLTRNCYSQSEKNGQLWLTLPSHTEASRIAVPLEDGTVIQGAIQIDCSDQKEIKITLSADLESHAETPNTQPDVRDYPSGQGYLQRHVHPQGEVAVGDGFCGQLSNGVGSR